MKIISKVKKRIISTIREELEDSIYFNSSRKDKSLMVKKLYKNMIDKPEYKNYLENEVLIEIRKERIKKLEKLNI